MSPHVPAWRGLFGGNLLPLDRAQDIDWISLASHLQEMSASALEGVFLNANIGEGPYMSATEREEVLKLAVSEIGDTTVLVDSIMPTSTREAARAAERSHELGADGLLVFPHPAFADRPVEPSAVVDYFRTIGEASGLPLIAYQSPETSGSRFDASMLATLTELDCVAAVKEGSWDAAQYRESRAAIEAADGDAALLADGDYLLSELVEAGAEGATVSCAVVAPHLWAELFEGRADTATVELLESFATMVFAAPFWSFRARLKAVLLDQGSFATADVRRPNLPMQKRDIAPLLEAARRMRA